MFNQKIIVVIALLAFIAMVTRGAGIAWGVGILGVIVGGAWLLSRRAGGGGVLGGYLCDTCKYNYGDVCTRPEKPNATKCPDYKRAG